jgi:hypothetical protein
MSICDTRIGEKKGLNQAKSDQTKSETEKV